jgi:hypothetical protein
MDTWSDVREAKIGRSFGVVAVATLAGAAFLVLHAAGRPLRLDDTHSTFHAFAGPGGVVESLRTDSHPPLYFLLLAAWMRVVGAGEAWLRVPSILFTLGAGLVLFRAAAVTGGPRAGWLVAALYAFNPVVTAQLHTVRPYALAGLIAAVSTVVWLSLALADGGGARRRWIVYVVTNVLGTITHYWFFFLLAGQGVGALLFARGRARLGLVSAIAASAVPFALLWTPVLLTQMQGAPTSWLEQPGGWWLLRSPVELLGGYDFRDAARVFYLLAVVVCVVRIRPWGYVRGRELDAALRDRRLGLLLAIPVVVLVLGFLLSQVRPIYHVRYTIVAIPAFSLLVAFVLARLGDRRLLPLLCLAFISAGAHRHLLDVRYELVHDNRAITHYLLDRYEPGDELVNVTLNYAPTVHYLRTLAPDRTVAQTVFPASVATHPGWRVPAAQLTDTLAVRTEASELATRLGAMGGRVWVLADHDQDKRYSRTLLDELERTLELTETIPMEGWWVSEIRLYTPPATP